MARPESYHPDYRLLPAVLDRKAANDPNGIYASLPRTNDLRDGLRDYTNSDVVRAIDSFSWWLENSFGRSRCFETLSYVGVNDLRYVVFFQACVKTGYKALFFSPRNTTEQNAALVKQMQCRHVFFSEEYKVTATSLCNVVDLGDLHVVGLDAIDTWIEKDYIPYPYNKSYEEACQDPIVVFHSSGSTGPPKTIIQNHQFFINGHRFPPLPTGKRGNFYDVYKFSEQSFATASFPFYHLAGFTSVCLNPVFYETCSMVYGFPNRPASAEIMLQILKLKPVRVINTPPSIIEGILRLPDTEATLRRLDAIIYAGGPLATWAGDKLSRYVNLVTNYGSTESGPVALLLPERHNWKWFDFHPAIHLRWDPVFDDVHELVFEKDSEADRYRPIGATILCSQDCFRTKDLFVPHPTQQGLWRFFGRNDDVVVFSNGFKWNPLPSEAIISSHPNLAGSIIVGTGLLQPIAVVERTELASHIADADLIRSIWSTVKRANYQTQRYGRVSRSKIMCVAPSTFLRTPKGSIARQATVRLLQQRISDDSDWSCDDGRSLPLGRDITSEDLVELIRTCILDELALEELDNSMDFFAAGMDSLGAIEICTTIRHALRPIWPMEKTTFLHSAALFAFPTLSSLTQLLEHELLHTQKLPTSTGSSDRDLIAKNHIAGDRKQATALDNSNSLSIAMTGSTGSLGSCLLEYLAQLPASAAVLCLNRSKNVEARMKKLLPSLSVQFWTKIKFRHFDTHEPNLGLDTETIEALEHCDVVIHCAWSVNFLQNISSFEDQIRGVQQLGQFALRSSRYQRLFFVSSVSAVSRCKTSQVNEDLYDDINIAASTGYGQSKQISERILGDAARHLALPVSILRVGQIAGYDPTFQSNTTESLTTFPKWNTNEWFPSIVRSAQNLGKVPQDFADIDWIPVNILSQIIGEIMVNDLKHSDLKVYNLVNPHKSPWLTIHGAINTSLPESAEAIPLSDWVALLQEKDANNLHNIDTFPALKLLRFVTERIDDSNQVQTGYDLTNSIEASTTMAALQPISEENIRFWISQWAKSDTAS